ncbi:alpha-D-ribose 1-methylphosphonate 5-triphosphate diphosphatase [Mycobacterium sp. pUA109]|uniref:alpha-D-ribose 1-methylphosphonate 5-triphosphate diphosphatase n=1 Tax=Mycobacterium sp. pUA109 TaxID=3238982 RepID=UPI00351B26A9
MISLRAARILTGGNDDTGWAAGPRWLTFDGDRIVDVAHTPPRGAARKDLGHLQLWPGITDLHADSLSHFQSPRPAVRIPMVSALYDFAVDAATHGITHPCLCVAVGEGPDPQQSFERARTVIDTVESIAGALPIPVSIHLRVDVSAPQSVDLTAELLRGHAERIRLVSAMDHTPGQGQYRDEASWRSAMGARLNLTDAALDRWLSQLHANASGNVDRRRRIGQLANGSGAVFATHDPDSDDAVVTAKQDGAQICEFPLTAEAASAAGRLGMAVAVGAPNAWRGASHLQNLSARTAIAAGRVDVLTSDYHSGAMVRAAVALDDAGVCALDQAVAMMTAHPACLIGTNDDPHLGTLHAGAVANLIAVDTAPIIGVAAVWSRGRQITGHRLGH